MLCYFSPVASWYETWSEQADLESVAQSVEAAQQAPAAEQPSAEEVLGVISQLLAAGFQVFSSVYGAVNAVNPTTGEVSTSSGTLPASDVGPLTSLPPGGGRGDTVTIDPGGAPEQTWTQQLGDVPTIVWILGAGVLAAVVLR